MSYRYLGRSGLKVSRLALGTMMFGGPTDEPTLPRDHRAAKAGRQLHRHRRRLPEGPHRGSRGPRSARPRRLGAGHKFANPLGGAPTTGAHRKWIIQAVEGSLRRLGTDYLDILYFHRADFNAPAGEAVRAIGDLVRAGKLRYFGVSNFRGWRIAEAAHLADAEGIDRPWPASRCTTWSTAAPRPSSFRRRRPMAWAWCPTARWRGRAHGQVQARPAAGRGTRAARQDRRLLETGGVRNRCASPAASATTSTPRASIPCNSRWAGCSTTGW